MLFVLWLFWHVNLQNLRCVMLSVDWIAKTINNTTYMYKQNKLRNSTQCFQDIVHTLWNSSVALTGNFEKDRAFMKIRQIIRNVTVKDTTIMPIDLIVTARLLCIHANTTSSILCYQFDPMILEFILINLSDRLEGISIKLYLLYMHIYIVQYK